MAKKFTSVLAAFVITASMAAQVTIIPKPNKMQVRVDNFTLNSSTVIYSNEKEEANLMYLQSFLKEATKFSFDKTKNSPSQNYIKLELLQGSDIPAEGYRLTVTQNGITITGSTSTGIF